MITTVHTNQTELLKNLMELYSIEAFDLDPCYSKGNFYKDLPQPKLACDIAPQFDFVVEADASKLILPEGTLSSIIFDPPFLATKGPSLGVPGANNLIAQRFTVFPTEQELFKFYLRCMSRFYIGLKKGGILVFKCQDKVSGGKQYMSHCIIYEMALSLGFYPRDLFVLVNENKMLGKWAKGEQFHAYKTHSYFWVFEKVKPRVTLDNLLKGEKDEQK